MGSDPICFGELARDAAPYRAELRNSRAWKEVANYTLIAALIAVWITFPLLWLRGIANVKKQSMEWVASLPVVGYPING